VPGKKKSGGQTGGRQALALMEHPDHRLEDGDKVAGMRNRLFAGLSVDEAAEAMGVSRATAFREWAYARSWLATALDSAR
jgi:hypothetical protein